MSTLFALQTSLASSLPVGHDLDYTKSMDTDRSPSTVLSSRCSNKIDLGRCRNRQGHSSHCHSRTCDILDATNAKDSVGTSRLAKMAATCAKVGGGNMIASVPSVHMRASKNIKLTYGSALGQLHVRWQKIRFDLPTKTHNPFHRIICVVPHPHFLKDQPLFWPDEARGRVQKEPAERHGRTRSAWLQSYDHDELRLATLDRYVQPFAGISPRLRWMCSWPETEHNCTGRSKGCNHKP
jgi:hypothetical protein